MVLNRLGLLSGGAGRRRRAEVNDDDEEDEEDSDDEEEDPYWGPSRKKPKQWYDLAKEPNEVGLRLARGGEFGPVSRRAVGEERLLTLRFTSTSRPNPTSQMSENSPTTRPASPPSFARGSSTFYALPNPSWAM